MPPVVTTKGWRLFLRSVGVDGFHWPRMAKDAKADAQRLSHRFNAANPNVCVFGKVAVHRAGGDGRSDHRGELFQRQLVDTQLRTNELADLVGHGREFSGLLPVLTRTQLRSALLRRKRGVLAFHGRAATSRVPMRTITRPTRRTDDEVYTYAYHLALRNGGTKINRRTLASPLRWYGGKASYAHWIRSYLPRWRSSFIDIFGGGASVLLGMNRSAVEVYNDIDPGPCNFFRMLRDRNAELQERIRQIPPTREAFYRYLSWEAVTDPLEQAAQFFIQFRTSYSGESSKNGKQRSYGFIGRYVEEKLYDYWNLVDRFPRYAERLSDVVIENQGFDQLIPKYDAPDLLLYADPPYPYSVRTDRGRKAYRYEMGENIQHEQLLSMLLKAQGMVAVSSYEKSFLTNRWNELYLDMLGHWFRTKLPCVSHAARWSTTSERERYREEVLWLNPQARLMLAEHGGDDPTFLFKRARLIA